VDGLCQRQRCKQSRQARQSAAGAGPPLSPGLPSQWPLSAGAPGDPYVWRLALGRGGRSSSRRTASARSASVSGSRASIASASVRASPVGGSEGLPGGLSRGAAGGLAGAASSAGSEEAAGWCASLGASCRSARWPLGASARSANGGCPVLADVPVAATLARCALRAALRAVSGSPATPCTGVASVSTRQLCKLDVAGSSPAGSIKPFAPGG